MNSPTDLASTTTSPSRAGEFLLGLSTTSTTTTTSTGQSSVVQACPDVDPTASAQAAVVVVITPPLASFDFNGVRCEVFASAHNLVLPASERRYYYSPALRLATTPTHHHHPAGDTDSQEEEEEDERECEGSLDCEVELETRMVELVDGFYKVSLVAEFDPPAMRRLAMTTLQSVLPAADRAALAQRESNLRALPVVRVGWRVVDPLPLDEIGVNFYHSSVPALTPGHRFPLELMVAGGESRARKVKRALARLTLTARLTFSARSVAAPIAAAAVAAHRAAAAVTGATASQPTQSVMIKTGHLIASQAWRTLWDRAQPSPPPAPAPQRWPRSAVKLEAGVSGGGRRVVGARKSDRHSLTTMMAGVLGWLGCEKTTFVGQVVRLAREFRGEIGAQPTQRMLEGSAAAAKFEELTVKYVNSSSRRVVLWEHAAGTRPLRSEPLLVQLVDVCQAQLDQALNNLFIKATTTTTDETKNGDDVSNDNCRYQFQAPRSGSSEAAHWVLWGGWPANGRDRSWTLAELQRELREKCGVWVEACQQTGRLVPVKLEAVVLSLVGLMPGGRERSIGCLHTAPATSGLPKLGPIFPDDGLRMHRELPLTNHHATGLIDSSAAMSSEETVDDRPLKRRKSEPDGDRTETTDDGADDDEEEGVAEPKAKRRRGRDEDEEDQLRCEMARMAETIARLTKDNQVLRQRERERATTTTETMRGSSP